MPVEAPTLLNPEPFTAALIQAVVLLAILRALDVWEREPVWVLALLALWGAVGATAISAPTNTAIFKALDPEVAVVFGAAISAPLVEEIAKGLALVAAVLASRWLSRRSGVAEFNGPTDGMIYGAAVGIGFAFAENELYFLRAVSGENVGAGLAVLELREGFLNLGTLGHAIYTGATGAGLGLAMWSASRVAKVGWSLIGLGVGMFLHAAHNGLIPLVLVSRFGFDTTARALGGEELPVELVQRLNAAAEGALRALRLVDYAALAVFAVALILWSAHQRRILRYELSEEANAGVIAADELAAMSTLGRRCAWYSRLFLSGRPSDLAKVRRAHHQLAELAFAKWRQRRAGGDDSRVSELRREIRAQRDLEARLAGESS